MKKKWFIALFALVSSVFIIVPVFAEKQHSTAKNFNLAESDVKNFYSIDGEKLPGLDFRGYNCFMITGDIRSYNLGDGSYVLDILVDGNEQFVNCTFTPGLIDKMTAEYKKLFADAKKKLIYKTFPGDGHYRIYLVCELTGTTIVGFQKAD